jgi:hypothetical protein
VNTRENESKNRQRHGTLIAFDKLEREVAQQSVQGKRFHLEKGK